MAGLSAIRDHKGYYAALEVPVTASAEQIKLAFRQKALQVHPDRNQSEDAKAVFQHLNEAYRVLMDARARARYDASVPEGPAAGAPRGAGRAPPQLEPIACSRCGAVTVQPRYVVFWRAISHGWGTSRVPVQGVFCRRCADGRALRASLVTWLLGWWGLPLGPVWTILILKRNMLGGEQPPDVNANLLRHQARYFMSVGNPVLARAALDQGLRLVESPDLHARLKKLEAMIGPGGRDRLVDRWRPAASAAFYLHLLPVVALLGGVALLAGRKAGWW
ncbi:MAG: J domain-containing protein [Rhodospirillaceae bacterium]